MKSPGREEDEKTRRRLQETPIAVIGMACLFPQARNLRAYWSNIVEKKDSITDVPADRWDVNDYYDPDPGAPDKTYSRRGGFLPEIGFDPMEFGIPPNILEVTDVSQLLALVVAKEVLEDAGYGASSAFDRDRIGIVLGVGGGQKLYTPLTTRLQYPIWKKALRASGLSDADADAVVERIKKAYVPWEENSFPGVLGNVIAGRVANRLNLGGMNCVVDAACASSLTAVKTAVSELLEHRSDLMITGGVDTDNSIFMYMCFSKTPALTDRDVCAPFDVDSNGMMVGEGVGMVALKRLEDAERDGDRIYAVILGIGTSSDGRFSSIYNPRPEGQAKALRRAYEQAGIPPSTVGLIEAHGTGTRAGDPAEVEALKTVFGADSPRRQSIALGSVKSQIGHTKAAAGIAGLIKASLALHHRVLPPTINVSRPNPRFDLENSPFYLNTETRPWIRAREDLPRRAGVSAFGFGGTNFHIVLEEYGTRAAGSYRIHKVPRGFLLAAPDPEALREKCRAALQAMDSDAAERYEQELAADCRTTPIPGDAARLGFVSASVSETRDLLKLALQAFDSKGTEEAWSLPKGVHYRKTGMDLRGGVVALFSGQGSQYVDMCREIVCNFPVLLETLRGMDRLFMDEGGTPLSEVVFPRPAFDSAERAAAEEGLRRTEFAQPAIGAVSAGLFKILAEAGFQPDFVAGHSFGELTALWAGGVLDDEGFFALARARGRAMAAPDDPAFEAGSMLAVIGEAEQILREVEKHPAVTAANLNSKKEVVLAGPTEELAALRPPLEEKGYRVVQLPVSAAFHTPLVGHAQRPFAEAIRATAFQGPACPIYSNTTGRRYASDPEAIRKTLSGHILKPVLFKEEIENIHRDGGRLFVEFGPKGILTKLVSNILEGMPHTAVALNPSTKRSSDRQLRQAVVELRVAGLPLKDVDPHILEERIPEARDRGKAAVKLTGANYVSEKTRKAWCEALGGGCCDGGSVQAAPAPAPDPEPLDASPPASRPGPKEAAREAGVPGHGRRDLESVERVLDRFFRHQGETLQIHEQYLNQHREYTRTFYDLLRQQPSSRGEGGPPGAMPKGVERSLTLFHNHQAETLRVHEQYLRTQAEISRSAIEIFRQDAWPTAGEPPAGGPGEMGVTGEAPAVPVFRGERIAGEPEPARGQAAGQLMHRSPATEEREAGPVDARAPVGGVPGIEAMTESMLQVVSEKTGYPVEMLEPDMEMEADLGIDSIKRVEILGAMMDLYPDLPEMNPEELAELRTLGQIVAHMGSRLSAAGTAPPEDPSRTSGGAAPGGEGAGIEAMTGSVLQVVSEKTGYPVEMLEPDMEMEADLGIDRIKLVEITGALRDRFTVPVDTGPDGLDSLRTVEDLARWVEDCCGSKVALREGEEKTQPSGTVEVVPKASARIKQLPAPDHVEIALPEDHVCLVTDDGTSTTVGLAEALMRKGWRVVVLSFPPSTVPEGPASAWGIPRVALKGLGEKHLQEKLREIEQRDGPIGGLIHLHPLSRQQGDEGIVFSETARDLLLHVFLLAKHLKPSLTRNTPSGRRFFVTVARLDGSLGIRGDNLSVVDGGIFGLVKTLNLEWESVFCRAIDLDPGLGDDVSIPSILQELHDPDGHVVETGYGNQGRVTLIAEPCAPAVPLDGDGLPGPSSVFVVSGGAKGVTASCIVRLASSCKCRFVLLGRSPLTGEEPDWAKGCGDVAELKKRGMEELRARGEKPTPKKVEKLLKVVLDNREISGTLRALREAGGEAEYLQADVTDVKSLDGLAPLVERLGQLAGVIHGAGVLADRLIEKKTLQDFQSVYATKVTGLESLLRSVDTRRLRYLILFSSAAGFYGNPGQSDYSMANEILNKAAYRFKRMHPDCLVRAFNWGPWDGGMVTASLKKVFEERRIQVIPVEQGTKIFVDGFSGNGGDDLQVVVGSSMRDEDSR